MPNQPDDREPTEVDVDMIVEEVTGKPVKPASLADGIASMRQLVKQLEAEKAKLLGRLDAVEQASAAALNQQLTTANQQLARARQRLNDFESQLGQSN